MANLGPYEGYSLRNSGYPEPIYVLGWWRWRWIFESVDGVLRPTLAPPPVEEIDPSPAVVSLSWIVGGKIVVDCYSREQVVPGDALAYVSILAAWIQYKNIGSEITVNGENRHPILVMSRLNERLIADLEEAGY